jgi:hypothetical protein
MAEVSNEIMVEVLKKIQAQVALVREDVDSVRVRLTSIDTRLGLVHTDMANQSERLENRLLTKRASQYGECEKATREPLTSLAGANDDVLPRNSKVATSGHFRENCVIRQSTNRVGSSI